MRQLASLYAFRSLHSALRPAGQGQSKHRVQICRSLVGVPVERLKGLHRAATAPQRTLSIQEKVDKCLTQLEHLASEKTDPEKIRWKRILQDLHKVRGALTAVQILRFAAVVSDHPLSLASARPLLELAMSRWSIALPEIRTTEHISKACLGLALAHAHGSSKSVDVTGLSNAVSKLLPKVFSSLPPPSVSAGQFFATPLFAAALTLQVSARTPPDKSSGGLHLEPVLNVVLGDDAFWRRGVLRKHMRDHSKALAQMVAAFGLMQSGGFLPDGNAVAQRVLRTLDIECFDLTTELPVLLLLDTGLRGLGLAESRLGEAGGTIIKDRLAATGAAAVPSSELCEALLMLRSCGRLKPSEPWVCDLIRHAANNVDRLKRGEKVAFQRLLVQVADQMEDRPGKSLANLAQAPPYPAGSPEAAVCLLARYNWFDRKSRQQVSWFKCRGALR
eukprot:TRINITY_DN103695_c0_g1_i1.p1 TRINITY_DN103695_c0_g1~~TRINITY_DN103695_c0_g1_i1.p1  ORF type:complete len:446 (-),score=76.37 TRINITY_DN103695_c0_g1_i1:99-1436(-)